MTTTLQPSAPAATVAPTPRRQSWRWIAIVVGIVLLLIAVTYAFAWYRASSLTQSYLRDADASYDSGKYLEALVGYEEFDPARNAYVTHGGYMQVEKIWADPYSWPRPAGVERAQTRIDEIINQKITIQEAENFIQANTGKSNPYFGIIYLRLGELYEQSGDVASAKDIYTSIEELFPGEQDLIARAKEHLARLQG
jgi:tetratricopeptide (TPR) repeat protein